MNLPRLAAALCGMLLIVGCATRPMKRSRSATEFVDSSFTRRVELDIKAIERSEPEGWRNLARHAKRVDGESSEAFSAACAYLLRRDPTIFLRRYLSGDEDAILCGRRAYEWSGEYRRVIDEVYRWRMAEARSDAERKRVAEFAAKTCGVHR